MRKISESTVRRLSLYLRFLEQCAPQKITISSDELARLGGTTSAQVRRDLLAFGSFGRRGIGYPINDLASRIRGILGLQRQYKVVLIGAGRMGSALVHYPGFRERGFNITAVYERAPKQIGVRWSGLRIRDVGYLERDLKRDSVDIAIITTPVEAAQDVAGKLVRGGVKAILNFAPTKLAVPEDVVVRTVNMAAELESLSFSLARGGIGHRE